MYDLPSTFNTQLLERCEGGLVRWLNFCDHHQNYGFGSVVNTRNKLFQDDWYGTDAYMLEVIFYERMQTYQCLTNSPSNADLFFVPFFSGLDGLSYLYGEKMREQQGRDLVEWLEKHATSSWGRYGGRDHFLIAGRTAWDFSRLLDQPDGWGTSLFNMPPLQNVTFMVLERRPWMENEQAIPYPVGFHPATTSSVTQWIDRVRSSDRKFLFSFSGALRPKMTTSIRGLLLQECLNATTECVQLDCSKIKCSHNPEPIYEKYLEADFCLQPTGDTATRRSTFDSIISGCIPVFFHRDAAHTQYTWHLPDEFDSFSVFIDEEAIKNGRAHVRETLKGYSRSQVTLMREKLISIIPKLVYRHPSGAAMGETMQDAFDVAVDGMLKKVSSFKEPSRGL